MSSFQLKVSGEIELKLLDETHAEALFARVENNRSILREWLPWLDINRSPEDSKTFIRASLDGFKAGKTLVAGIWYREQLAGVMGFNTIDRRNKNASIGYWLGNEFQKLGIATQACRALIEYGFKELKLHRIEIACATGNLKSQAIPKRLGLKEEGRARETEWLYDHFVDHIQYAVLANEWKSS